MLAASKNFRYLPVIFAFLTMAYPGFSQASHYVMERTFSADGNPHFPGINAVTKRLYVSDVTAGTVTMFDALTGVKLVETPTGVGAHTVIVDEVNNLVYVTNRGANTLSILDGNTNTKLADVAVGSLPHGLDLDLEHKRSYVSNTGSNDVTVVDMVTRTVTKTIPTSQEPWGVYYDGDNNWIYTSNTYEGTVSRIDPETGTTLAKIIVGGRPWNVKVSTKTGRVYASNETNGVLSVIEKDNLIASIPVGATGRGVVLDDQRGFAFVVASGSNQVTIVDTKLDTVSQNIAVGTAPAAVTFDRITSKVYVANQGGGTISVLTPGNPWPIIADVNTAVVSGVSGIWKPIASDPNGDPITCRLGAPPQNGSATVASDCSSGTYQSSPGFVGADSFTYLANDGHSDSDPGTVTIAVTEPPPSDPCLAQYPVTQFSQTGKVGTITINFVGNTVSHTNKEVKVCPSTRLSYQATSTLGPVVCKVKNNTTRGTGTLRINDHLKCTDKPAGKDKIQFKVKSGVG